MLLPLLLIWCNFSEEPCRWALAPCLLFSASSKLALFCSSPPFFFNLFGRSWALIAAIGCCGICAEVLVVFLVCCTADVSSSSLVVHMRFLQHAICHTARFWMLLFLRFFRLLAFSFCRHVTRFLLWQFCGLWLLLWLRRFVSFRRFLRSSVQSPLCFPCDPSLPLIAPACQCTSESQPSLRAEGRLRV